MEYWIVRKKILPSGTLAANSRKIVGPFFDPDAAKRRLADQIVSRAIHPGYQILIESIDPDPAWTQEIPTKF